jgi:hypothetical protein
VSVIDDEDRTWKARCAEAPDGWPFDADRDDPLTALRIAVTSSHPTWAYLVAFDRESEERPTDAEAALLASFLDEYKAHWYGDGPYRRRMQARPLDVDGGANGVIFHKWAADDWGYRRHSYERGHLFSVVPPALRGEYSDGIPGPLSLLALMDRINGWTDGPSPRWEAWKAAHPDVFRTED